MGISLTLAGDILPTEYKPVGGAIPDGFHSPPGLVDVLTIADPDDVEIERFVFGRVSDSVVTLPKAIALRARQFDCAFRPQLISKGFYAFNDPLPIGSGGNGL